MTTRIFLALLVACIAPQLASAADDAAPVAKRAVFEKERASTDARSVADWVVRAGDNHAGDNRVLPFVIVDKKEAKIFVFHANGQLRGAAPALLGQAIGDESIAGIGNLELKQIRPEQKTTPAGRFVGQLGIGDNLHGQDVLWVDYEGAVSIHRVIEGTKERRPQRLATPTTADKRISFGCINVPKKFYESVVRPAFLKTRGIIYVLPEVKPLGTVFSSYDADGAVATR
jgi:hypothetical protein